MPRYDGPIIDTHHHIWRRTDVSWLADPPVPRMFGDYFGLRRDYPVEEWMNERSKEELVGLLTKAEELFKERENGELSYNRSIA